MIRITVTDSENQEKVLQFRAESITLGRAPDNNVQINDESVSNFHGRITVGAEGAYYEDLDSTNGTVIQHGSREIRLHHRPQIRHTLKRRSVIRLGTFSIRLTAEASPVAAEVDVAPVTIAVSRAAESPPELRSDLADADPSAATAFLKLVRESSGAMQDEAQLKDVISNFIFQVLPQSTHLILALRDPDDGNIKPWCTRSRKGRAPNCVLSRTIVNRVLCEGVSLLFSQVQTNMALVHSVVASRIETAICAPLTGHADPFGLVQLDIRAPAKGSFKKGDLDLLSVLACHVALVLDNRRLYREQHRALQSTINALVHSLSLQDPDSAYHSERVQAISMIIGQQMGLREAELELLKVASILHDLGRQATPDESLFRQSDLTDEEANRISHHADLTQGILDKVHYPEYLTTVPQVAAHHHERMDGKGALGMPGDQIPMAARIIAVADAFDVLASGRSAEDPKPLSELLSILEMGRDRQWDRQVVDVVALIATDIVQTVYGQDSSLARSIRIDVTDDRDQDAAS